MKIDSVQITGASFEPLAEPKGPGWSMRVSGGAVRILHRASPFVARVGSQTVEGVVVSANGDVFAGYLRQLPHTGDRLFVGYGMPDVATPFIYQGNSPSVS
jgi:hypothetical protein